MHCAKTRMTDTQNSNYVLRAHMQKMYKLAIVDSVGPDQPVHMYIILAMKSFQQIELQIENMQAKYGYHYRSK